MDTSAHFFGQHNQMIKCRKPSILSNHIKVKDVFGLCSDTKIGL